MERYDDTRDGNDRDGTGLAASNRREIAGPTRPRHVLDAQIARTFRCSEKQVHAGCVRVVYRRVADDGFDDWSVAVAQRLKKILASA
jgi:hypothetical protein